MAILSSEQLAELRRAFINGSTVAYDKTAINLALQQVEDWFEANRASLGAAITGTWTVQQKKRLVKFWLLQKYGRE